MRKTCRIALLSFLLSLGFLSLPGIAVDLVVDSKPLPLDVAPRISNGRTLVPLRAIFEALGAQLDWDQPSQTATATLGSDVVKITVGSQTAYHNGKAVTLDVPATQESGRVLVPARFVSEALSAKVFWIPEPQTVRVATVLYEVKRVVDGDTIVVDFQGEEERLRMIGIDTPESVHPDADKNSAAGKTAADYTKSQLSGKQVELEFDVQERDQYGRLLAYVYLDGIMYNKTLLKEGYANLATFPPNVKYVEDFKSLVAARQNADTGKPVGGKPESSSPVQTAGKYLGSFSSDKYHLSNCRWAKEIKAANQTCFQTKEAAAAAGYVPCSVCKP